MNHIPLLVGVALLAGACSNAPSKPEPHDHSSHAHDTTKAVENATPGMEKSIPSVSYPLKTCVVSGEDLGAMGERIAYTYEGTEVQFCCADCIDEFRKDPQTYLATVRAAKK